MRTSKILICVVSMLLISACAESVDKVRTMNWTEVAGTLGGAAFGGYVGAQFGGGLAQTAFTAAGVLVGGGAGYAGSRYLTQGDVVHHNSAAEKALADSSMGQLHRWTNPESGRSGFVRTVSKYKRADGVPCAEYRTSVVFADGVSSASGGACQQPDGQWLAFNNDFR